MKLNLQDKSTITVSHNGEMLYFPISGTNSYESTKLVKIVEDDEGNPYDPFANINDYVRTLNRKSQQDIFDAYLRVAEIFGDVHLLDELKDDLTDCFRVIFEIVQCDPVEAWMDKNKLIHIPQSIYENEFTHYNEDRTYSPEKYKGLIALTVVLKLGVPIWGAYIKYITKGTGVGRKEIHCAQLLKTSKLVDSRQYNEFVDFIVSTYDVGKPNTNAIITGVGTEEQITLLPAACLVRKIAVAPNLKSKSAVTEAFNYIVNKGPTPERKHPFIVAKKVVKGGIGEIEEQALLETYKDKESISPGDIQFITYCAEQTDLYLEKLCPGIPKEWIKEAEKLRDYLIEVKFKPTLMNIRLLQFYIEGIPPQIVPSLDSPSIIELMHHVGVENPEQYQTHAKESLLAVLFTGLVYMGYPSIALMVTAIEVDDDVDTSIGNSRKQIPADIDAKLDELYPTRVSGGKDSINMVKEAISRYFNSYSGRSFRSVYTEFFKQHIPWELEDREGNHYLRPETPITLAKITIDIYGRNPDA